jgi:hypothetical protein
MGNTQGHFNSRQFTQEQRVTPTHVGTIEQSQFIEFMKSATDRTMTATELKRIMGAVSFLPFSGGKPTYRCLGNIMVACFHLHTANGYGGVDGHPRSDRHKERRTWAIIRKIHGDEQFLVVITYGESMDFLEDSPLDKPENNGYRLLGTMAHNDFDNFGLSVTYVHAFQKMTQ